MATGTRAETPILVGTIAIGLIAILLGVSQLRRTIAMRVGTSSQLASGLTDDEAAQRAVLAALDTDGDGLTDYDELDRTFTSPYLADSDSDGVSDKDEIDAGDDPNCPSGTVCDATREEAIVRPNIPRTQDAVNIDAANIDIAALRAALEEQGVSREILSTLGDDELRSAFQEQLTTLQQGPSGAQLPFGESISQGFSGALQGEDALGAALDALPRSPDEVRASLAQTGFPQEQLNALSDEQLLALWEQTILELRTTQQLP
jgi:hypothetical protein